MTKVETMQAEVGLGASLTVLTAFFAVVLGMYVSKVLASANGPPGSVYSIVVGTAILFFAVFLFLALQRTLKDPATAHVSVLAYTFAEAGCVLVVFTAPLFQELPNATVLQCILGLVQGGAFTLILGIALFNYSTTIRVQVSASDPNDNASRTPTP